MCIIHIFLDYYPPNFQNNAFYDNSKAQKTARVAGNMHSATEIPHLYVDDRSMNAGMLFTRPYI